jgi:hypothetical protein
MSRGQRGGSPTVVNLIFLDRSRYFSFKQLLIYPHEAEWTPFQTHCYSGNLVAPVIEPGTSGLAARNSDHWTTEGVLVTLYFSHLIISYVCKMRTTGIVLGALYSEHSLRVFENRLLRGIFGVKRDEVT